MRMFTIQASWFALFCFVATVATGFENETGPTASGTDVWTQFRGPNSSGIAGQQSEVPVKFGLDKNLLWKRAILPGASSPCIWEDRIFLTSYDKPAKRLDVLCLDRSDGRIRWQREVATKKIERVHAASTPASGTITTDGERVYAYFGSRGLLCYDMDGNQIWAYDMPVIETRNGSGTSPVLTGDLVLLNRDLSEDPHLLALDKVSGEVVWKHSHLFAPGMLSEGYATPVLWKGQAILHTHAGIRAISLSDGKLIWKVNAATTGCSTPVVFGNRLFVATWQNLGEPALRGKVPTFEELTKNDKDANGMISFNEFPKTYVLFDRPEARDETGISMPLSLLLGMIDTDMNRELTREEWDQFQVGFSTFLSDHGLLAIELGGEGDVTETHVTVLEKKNIPEVPSPLVHDGRVYMVKNGGVVNCLDATTGKRLFQKRISATGSYYASPIAVGNHIYLASGQGVISVLKSGPKLEVIAQNDLAERIMATPAVVDNTLYVRTNEHLFAFASDTKSGE